jgi:predicted 3-demethylubiquinone-9 3-methyltransferase (glyoxalase superfamily)
MQKIIPHLWYDKQARAAAELYTSVFPDSKINNISTIYNTPSGDADIVSFTLSGQPFMAISAGPLFKFNPSVSFQVKCKTVGEVDDLWNKLSDGGSVLMELGRYPFSQKYGWCNDRYGLSWQIIATDDGDIRQKITPVLMFVGNVCGKAEEAVNYYTSLFPNSNIEMVSHYGKGEEPDKEGTVKYASFTLIGTQFGIMDSARAHNFKFNEAISFIVRCDAQEEIDFFWKKLSAVPEAEACGWLKDWYGLSWQIVPTAMDEMMSTKDEHKLTRVTEAFLKMKKFDISELRKAYNG